MKTPLILALLASLVLSACGSDSDDSSSDSTVAAPTTSTSSDQRDGPVTIVVAKTKLGSVLAGDEGLSVYMFEKDKGDRSSCYDACAATWPPVTTNGEPLAGTDIKKNLLGTSTRKDGQTQVSYNGHPLYYYTPDTQQGEVKGNDLNQFGADWYALQPSGAKVEDN